MSHFDYARFNYGLARHHERFVKYIASTKPKLICQECGGEGGHTEIVLPETGRGGPWYDCGWCEGTGFITKWERARWLRWKKEEHWRNLCDITRKACIPGIVRQFFTP